MGKRAWIYTAIILCFALTFCAYLSLKSRKSKQETRREPEPTLIDWQEEKKQLLALGEIDLNPSSLTLAKLEQELKMPVLKQRGDFNTTRLAWVCDEEHCTIWASFLVPFGQDIPPNSGPAGLVIDSPPLGDFPNIKIGEIHLGGSDQKLVELLKGSSPGTGKQFRRTSWDKDWTAAWASLDGKVFELVFSNERLLRPLEKGHQSATPAPTE